MTSTALKPDIPTAQAAITDCGDGNRKFKAQKNGPQPHTSGAGDAVPKVTASDSRSSESSRKKTVAPTATVPGPQQQQQPSSSKSTQPTHRQDAPPTRKKTKPEKKTEGNGKVGDSNSADNNQSPSFPCDCGKKFKNQGALRAHRATAKAHAPPAPFRDRSAMVPMKALAEAPPAHQPGSQAVVYSGKALRLRAEEKEEQNPSEDTSGPSSGQQARGAEAAVADARAKADESGSSKRIRCSCGKTLKNTNALRDHQRQSPKHRYPLQTAASGQGDLRSKQKQETATIPTVTFNPALTSHAAEANAVPSPSAFSGKKEKRPKPKNCSRRDRQAGSGGGGYAGNSFSGYGYTTGIGGIGLWLQLRLWSRGRL